MTDTTILPNVPGYVQLSDQNHHNHGITCKDRLHSNADFANITARSLSVDVERNGRSSELAIEKTAAAIMAVTVNGMCEIKERMLLEGEKTRTLISTLDNQRLANLLVAANQEILALRIERCQQPNTCA